MQDIKALVQETREHLGFALDAIQAVRCAIEVIKTGVLSQTIAAGVRYAEIENAQDLAERLQLALQEARDKPLVELEAYPLKEFPGYNEEGAADIETDAAIDRRREESPDYKRYLADETDPRD